MVNCRVNGRVNPMVNVNGKTEHTRHILPSRKRYEERHPVISTRVDKASYDGIKDIKEA